MSSTRDYRADERHDTEARAPIDGLFFNPFEEIQEHWHNLPHWQQSEVWQFVTWRLSDASPKLKLDEWRGEKEAWLRQHPRPWDEETARTYHRLFSARLDAWLDAGHGSCILRRPACAEIVAGALRHFAGERYTIDAFVVMPNHVHTLFRPLGDHSLESILHSWKSFTAKELNKSISRRGALWQEDYWDRMIRNEAHFDACRKYIMGNPTTAGLSTGEYVLDIGGKRQ